MRREDKCVQKSVQLEEFYPNKRKKERCLGDNQSNIYAGK